MTKTTVRLVCDVNCDWEGLQPTYRAYVNDELFAERTWTWTDDYLEEMLQIEAEPGKYRIRYELVPPNLAEITASNFRVDFGPGQCVKSTLRIEDEI